MRPRTPTGPTQPQDRDTLMILHWVRAVPRSVPLERPVIAHLVARSWIEGTRMARADLKAAGHGQ